MKPQFEKNAGIALIVFTLLMIFTMVLHPVGGGFEHLHKIRRMLMIVHVVALLSLPFAAVGFWGLTKRLGTDNFFSISAFAFIAFGLVAVMIAATANGLILPIFIEKYKDASAELTDTLKPILRYNTSVNQACDYLYTGSFCLAMLFWSIAVLYTKKLPVWIAYFGITLSIFVAVLFASGFAFTSLHGFRVFVSGIVLWVVMVGILLARTTGSGS
jgi:hypothetical protein